MDNFETFRARLKELLPAWQEVRPGRMKLTGHPEKVQFLLSYKEITPGVYEVRADADVTQELTDMYREKYGVGEKVNHAIDTSSFTGYLIISTHKP